MSFVKLPHCPPESISDRATSTVVRPEFHHQNTEDRLRESDRRPSPFSIVTKIRKGRRSVFKEHGLSEEKEVEGSVTTGQDIGQAARLTLLDTRSSTTEDQQELLHVGDAGRDTGKENINEEGDFAREERTSPTQPQQSQSAGISPQSPTTKTLWYKLATGRRSKTPATSSAPTPTMHGLPTVTMAVLLLTVIIPFSVGWGSRDKACFADAGPIVRRADSPTNVCKRWSQQSAILNGTMYIYGGQAKSTADQVNDTWNNNFLTLDLTNDWDTTSPSLTGLTQPDGPPAVANGYLWNDYNNLYLYGGEFADNPYVDPAPVSTWKYDIKSGTWLQYSNLRTSVGNSSDGGGVAVQRSAEGAGISVPELGLSWYFGGHLDMATTPGWSGSTARVYLSSLLEFTHPGYANDGVTSLSTGSGAPQQGVYRNITQGGLQTTDTFSERADGVLVFVPGWGTAGVLIGLAGGTADEFTDDMSTLDVYDIASSQWYHQKTTGTAPSVRVNPCAVIASAPDASSFQIYLFGGQNLQPYKEQTQYSDMYILTIPAFTWVGPISQSGSNQPTPRAGHSCNLRDGQMIVVGGYVGTTIDCDSPGIYVFNTSSLQWADSFTSLSPQPDLHPENSVLGSSYGYTVPDEVVRIIGGSPHGSATITTPAASATDGPFATGKSPVFTITASGSTATITSPGSTQINNVGGGSNSSQNPQGVSGGLIAAVVCAVIAGLTAGYLGYCAWLYRRQVRAYKQHLAVANRYSAPLASRASLAGLAGLFGMGHRNRDSSQTPMDAAEGSAESRRMTLPRRLGGTWRGYNKGKDEASGASTSAGEESFAWVGRGSLEPKSSTEPTPSGSGTSPYTPGSGWRPRRGSGSEGSMNSMEGLLDGQELSFFSVVMAPRRALRVVNGFEEVEH